MNITGFYHTCVCGNIMSPNVELDPEWKPEVCIHAEVMTVTKELVKNVSDGQILDAIDTRIQEVVKLHLNYNKGKNILRKETNINFDTGVITIKLYANHKPFKINANHSDVKKATYIEFRCGQCGVKCLEMGK